jgi:hypothetical protein
MATALEQDYAASGYVARCAGCGRVRTCLRFTRPAPKPEAYATPPPEGPRDPRPDDHADVCLECAMTKLPPRYREEED